MDSIQITTSPVISQKLMHHLQAGRAKASYLNRANNACRSEIMDLLQEGCPIEPGDLACKIQIVRLGLYSREALLAAFGQERFAWIEKKVKPTERKHLIVFKNSHTRNHDDFQE